MPGITMSSTTPAISPWRSRYSSMASAPARRLERLVPKLAIVRSTARRTIASSSTTSTSPEPCRGAATCFGVTGSAGRGAAGNDTRNVVPRPSIPTSISIVPWWSSTMPYTVASPSPVPRSGPWFLVVKYGSNT